jgi:hypothetical protein
MIWNAMMSNSDRRINYSVRPAKSIERKLIRDLLLCLYPFGGIERYRYVGFGSKFFTDFALFHRAFGISDMVSIESDTSSKAKYEFNKPYRFIQMKFGLSTDVLPTLSFDKKTVFWLDYDSSFNSIVLADLAVILERAVSGTVLLSSFNSKPFTMANLKERYSSEGNADLYRQAIAELVGEESIPVPFVAAGLGKWKTYVELLRSIYFNEVSSVLMSKNSGLPEGDRWCFEQIIYMNYKDGVEMTTFGGVVFQEKERSIYESCDFKGREVCRFDGDPLEIKVPSFTIKEMQYLMGKMPVVDIEAMEIDHRVFPRKDVEDFSEFYRHFPAFSEVENI